LLPGYRKIVRKWNEEIMRFQARKIAHGVRQPGRSGSRLV
jgi:hypothetical protein